MSHDVAAFKNHSKLQNKTKNEKIKTWDKFLHTNLNATIKLLKWNRKKTELGRKEFKKNKNPRNE